MVSMRFGQNGFGNQYEQEGRRWSSNVETRPRCEKFLKTWSGPGQAFRNLPVAMAKRTARPQHYWNIVYVSTKIQAEEFGFSSAPQFVKCRGWVLSRRRGKFVLEYRKVKEIIHAYAPSNAAATMVSGFNAMIDQLYELQKKGVRDIYTGETAIRYLEKISLVSALNRHCQEFQIAMIIVEKFFLPHVPHHKGDIDYWLKAILFSCRRRKDLMNFFDNVFTLFQDGDDKALATELLALDSNCMRDEVSRHCANVQHRKDYEKRVETQLRASFERGTRSNKMPDERKNVLLCRSRTHDWAWMHLPEYKLLTLKRSKKKSSKKRHCSLGEFSCGWVVVGLLDA